MEAKVGYTLNEIYAGKGGIAAFISSKWSSLVSQSGSLFGRRVLWFILFRIPRGDLGFMNKLPCPYKFPPSKSLGKQCHKKF